MRPTRLKPLLKLNQHHCLASLIIIFHSEPFRTAQRLHELIKVLESDEDSILRGVYGFGEGSPTLMIVTLFCAAYMTTLQDEY